ncbi:hypothetical protein Q5O14_09005 [Eubacteriaceae bacterium ES2]|nr:hypothetical protein Q5O14_09005 [Eubacteriaceae bacterium ES2]
MKRKYYLDTVLLIVMIITTVLAFGHIERVLDWITLGIFLILSLVINRRFSIVLKIPVVSKASVGEKLQYFGLITGKLLYLVYMVNFIIVEGQTRATLIFLIFIFNSIGFMNITYLGDKGMVLGFSRIVEGSQITNIDRKKHYFDYYYCHVTLKSGEIVKLNLSQDIIERCVNQFNTIIKGESNV